MALLPPADRENRLMQNEEVVEDEYNALVGLINKKFDPSCIGTLFNLIITIAHNF